MKEDLCAWSLAKGDGDGTREIGETSSCRALGTVFRILGFMQRVMGYYGRIFNLEVTWKGSRLVHFFCLKTMLAPLWRINGSGVSVNLGRTTVSGKDDVWVRQ